MYYKTPSNVIFQSPMTRVLAKIFGSKYFVGRCKVCGKIPCTMYGETCEDHINKPLTNNTKTKTMGKVITPRYRIEMSYISFTNKRRETAKQVYDSKVSGEPSAENAKKYRDGMNASMSKGQSNEHLRSGQSDYSHTWIIDQHNGQTVVAEYKPPMFEII